MIKQTMSNTIANEPNILNSQGIRVIRIPNNQIMNNFNGVCEYIDR